MHEEHFEDLAGDVAVERAISLPVDPDTVWRHLIDGDLLGEWMGGEVDIDARPGGSIALVPEVGQRVWGTIEEVVAGKRLQWSWRTDEGMPTQVEIDLEEIEAGTELVVRETLLPWRTHGIAPMWLPAPGPGDTFLAAA